MLCRGTDSSARKALMKSLKIAENKRVGGLGVNQAQALIEKLDGVTE